MGLRPYRNSPMGGQLVAAFSPKDDDCNHYANRTLAKHALKSMTVEPVIHNRFYGWFDTPFPEQLENVIRQRIKSVHIPCCSQSLRSCSFHTLNGDGACIGSSLFSFMFDL